MKERFSRGQRRVAQRLSKASSSLSKTSPTIQEVEVIHNLYLASKEVKMQKEAIINAYQSSTHQDVNLESIINGVRKSEGGADNVSNSDGKSVTQCDRR